LVVKQQGNQLLLPQTNKAILLIGILLIISCFTAYKPLESAIQLANFLPLFLLFAILPFLLQTTVQLEQLAVSLIAISLPISSFGIIEFISGRTRPASVFENPNTLASYLVVILGIELGLLLHILTQKKSKLLFDVFPCRSFYISWWQRFLILNLIICLSLGALLISGSRNGLLSMAIQILIFIFILGALIKQNPIFLFSSLGILIITGNLIGRWLGTSRHMSLQEFVSDPDRIEIWRVAFSLIQERPLFGWGLGSYINLYPLRSMTTEHFAHPHNFWLLLASEAGFPVMFGLTTLAGYICYQGIQVLLFEQADLSRHWLLLGYLLAFSGCTSFALFDCTFYDIQVNVTNWLVLACIYKYVELELRV
jgi:O-antigen ligase